MDKLCVGVTTFFGTNSVKEVVRRLLKYSPADVEISIWDNSPVEFREIEEFVVGLKKDNVVYLADNGQNLGQTGSKNRLVNYYIEKYGDEAKYVLLLDQDVYVNFGFYEECKRIIEKYPDAGIVTFNEAMDWETCTEPHPRYPSKDGDVYAVGDYPGSFWYISVDAFKKIKGFDERYFFHSYDSDYAQRMQYNTKYRIYLSSQNGFITHDSHYTGKNFSLKREQMIQRDFTIWSKVREQNGYWFVPDISV